MGPSPEHAEVAVTESAGSTNNGTLGVLLIAGSLVIGFLLFLVFPMPQTYSTPIGGEDQVFHTECTVSGDVLWDPSPAINPDHVTQAENYCQQWSGTVVALSIIIPVLGVVGGAFLLSPATAKTEDDEDVDEVEEPAAV